jgi:signal peptidase I
MVFELFLTLATLLALVLIIIDKLFLKKSGLFSNNKRSIVIEYAYSFFPVLAIVLVLRSFVIEPFRIPSASMKPTLLIGDFILVNKSAYSLRLPAVGTKLVSISQPKMGDVVVFRHKASGKDIIKRVIGVPGCFIEYKNEQLFIDGKIVTTEFISKSYEDLLEVVKSKETLPNNVEHEIYHYPHANGRMNYKITSIIVPEGKYFVMGENRNDSEDSRFFGFVSENELLGKAVYIWLSLDLDNGFKIRVERFGKKII